MTIPPDDRACLGALVDQYLAVAHDPAMDERRELWRRLHNLEPTRPLVYLRGGRVWGEVPEIQVRECAHPVLRGVEGSLRNLLFRASLGDDSIFEPWLTVRPVFRQSGWGLSETITRPDEAKGAWKADHPLKDLDDLSQLVKPQHAIDEAATAERLAVVQEAVGDRIDLDLDRSPCYTVWSGDLSTDLGRLRGIEQFMIDMYEDPEGLHRLLAFIRDGVLAAHAQAEAATDWGLSSHQNQAMPYAKELDDPAPNQRGRRQTELWGFLAAQEFTLVSPAMHDEFLLQYQLPILERFALTAYGCCEDLTRKIDMLRQIPNLRRIAVAPLADPKACAEQIGNDYVMSYRPNPSLMLSCGYDEDRVRKIICEALDSFAGLSIDITLKDVDTAENDPTRLKKWTRLVRGLVEDRAGAFA